MKTNRRSEITEDGRQRIISAPGGTWQVQHLVAGQANTREECHVWRCAGRPLPYDEARRCVGARMTEVGTGPRQKRRMPRRLSRFLAQRSSRR